MFSIACVTRIVLPYQETERSYRYLFVDNRWTRQEIIQVLSDKGDNESLSFLVEPTNILILFGLKRAGP